LRLRGDEYLALRRGPDTVRLGIAPEPYRMGRVGEISDLPARPEPFCIMPIGFASGKFASKILKFIACKSALAF